MIGSKARGRFDYASPPTKWKGEHDLTDPRSLVCIAGELREREKARQDARRRAWEARRRRSWLRRAAGWVESILWRPDRAQTGRPEGTGLDPTGRRCSGCGCGAPLVASVRASLQSALGDDPAAVN